MLRRYASGSRRGRFGGSPSEHVSDRRTDAVCVRVRDPACVCVCVALLTTQGGMRATCEPLVSTQEILF